MSQYTRIFGVGGHRLRTVVLTSGAGVYTPTTPGNRHLVTLLGGGQNGRPSTYEGGQAGAMRVFEMVIDRPVSYVVGAAGADTIFGQAIARAGWYYSGQDSTYLRTFANSYYADHDGAIGGKNAAPLGSAFAAAGGALLAENTTAGGSSLYGAGGTSAGAATGYGAGGAAVDPYAAGTGGLIIVEEYT